MSDQCQVTNRVPMELCHSFCVCVWLH